MNKEYHRLLKQNIFNRRIKMRAFKSHVNISSQLPILFLGACLFGIVQSAMWIIAPVAIMILGVTFFGEFPIRKLHHIFSMPERVDEVEEKQDDMADIMGLDWKKIPEQKFYHLKNFDTSKYLAKKQRKLKVIMKK